MRKLNGVGSSSPGCAGKARPVDGASVETRRRAGLQPATAQAKLLQRLAEQDGIRLAGASRGILLLAAVNQPVEECSGRDDDGLRADGAAVAKANAENAASASGRSASPSLVGSLPPDAY